MKAADRPFYNLWMFPYPSAEGLHAGHAFSSTGSDIYGRFKKMNNMDVFQPIGYDSFGIHSENYAIKIGQKPAEMLTRTTKHYEDQLRSLGHGYDWSRTVTTSSPDYYEWTQWLFTEMFKAGLAYKKRAAVNFCPSCKTVLADEQVMTPAQAGKGPIDSRGNPVKATDDTRVCERCGTVVEKRELEQWFFKITEYAERLLAGLKKIDWSPRVKIAQKEWIGKKEGIEIKYPIKGKGEDIVCFTTRPDTNFGATFVVVAPEYAKRHLLKVIPDKYRQKVSKYIEDSLKKTEQQRKEEGRKKTGQFTSLYAINQLNDYEMPIYVSDFVLMDFGTGAVVGVPGHDKRDFEFAKEFGLEVKRVVVKTEDVARSYLMGAKDISNGELKKLGISIIEDSSSNARKLEIPVKNLSKYKKLVKDKLEKGYWNEVVGHEVWFLFKEEDGAVREFVLSEDSKEEIARLCTELNKDPIEKTRNIWLYLADNDWYEPFIIQEDEGVMVNSEFLTDLDIHKATVKMMDFLEKKGWGKRVITYHLRDWLVSRQRYWGAPIPMIYCKVCGWQPVPESDLPVLLPDISDYKPKGEGKGPLANHPEFYETKCPKCGQSAQRETDVMDTFVDSSWYFLRYPSVGAKSSNSKPFDPQITKTWLPVNLYFGGAEHSVLHLMYARFVTMVLHDRGHINFEEPFPRFFAHGLMIKDGAKMSKSRGNVVNPDEYISKYGADTLRLYLTFMGPMDGYPDFRDEGIEGMKRFSDRVWDIFVNHQSVKITSKEDTIRLLVKTHQTIKKVTEDIEQFGYNTAIASIMELVNLMRELIDKYPSQKGKSDDTGQWNKTLEVLVKLFTPFAPHLAEEIWVEVLGLKFSVHGSHWPKWNSEVIEEQWVTIVVQVDGRVRGQIEVESDGSTSESHVTKMALADPKVAKWLKEGRYKRSIFVPGKLINFVLR